ncbi:acriflavine resistance protein B [Pokkaliibacter plantistimulans]|uniref:Acriflavine resistance protein B n=1 Tax=Proteobacteria bacterium 228 TaxID=2083153 RepID=A0A2S5KUY0_9PROT|nr:efflux RND transporter permease subunit [Pokkaliibacter plantistimulans]PPC78495.1 acriflavine resistance protein B [Pokkaliibacter plantistimulans]
MNLSELCIRRPVMTVLLMLTFVVFGSFAYRMLPVSALPQVEYPTISVSASLSGASPETMAASVATPLEKEFATISGVTAITSSSTQGSTRITLEFDLSRDIDSAAMDVQTAISQAQRSLPDEMTSTPRYRKSNPADRPVLLIALRSDILPLTRLDELAEGLVSERLATLTGISEVDVYGSRKYAVRVKADPQKLAAMGLSLSDLESAISTANSNSPLGSVSGDQTSLTIEASGQLKSAAEFARVIIANVDGKPVRLSDVAEVRDGIENEKVSSSFNGKTAIVLAVRKQSSANTLKVVDAVKAQLPVLQKMLPADVTLIPFNDGSASIRESVHDVQLTMLFTMVLVVMVIFLFLRNLAMTIIPAVTLPIALIGTFAGMYLFGFSLDNLSLLALTLAVGFIVDDAIVVLENIMRHIENGEHPFKASIRGAREIGFTILSMTLSLVAVFIPVMFMSGIVGRMFHEFAIVMAMAIFISGFISLTLTPMMCSRLKVRHNEQHGRVYQAIERGFDAVLAGYRSSLKAVLRVRLITLLLTLASVGISVWLFQIVPKGFFPEEDTGLIIMSTEAREDVAFPAMVKLQNQVLDLVLKDPAVATVNSSVGSGGPNDTSNAGRMFIALKPLKERDASARQVINRIRHQARNIPGINVFMVPIQNLRLGGRASKSQYQYTLQGSDLSELNAASQRLEQKLAALPQLTGVTSDLQVTNPQLRVDIDRDKASSLGVSVSAARSQIYSAYGTRQIGTIYTSTDDYAIILESAYNEKNSQASLDGLYVPGSNGALVPLSAVATLHRDTGPLTVNHQSSLPSVTLSFDLASGVSLSQAVTLIDQAQQQADIPASITGSFAGTAQAFQQSQGDQVILILSALFVIYVILGILYESYWHPITILSGLPSAAIGALAVLLMFKMDLSVIAMIGIVMLLGIVKKNAIMMIDFAVERRKDGQVSAEEAIVEACMLRFRPIMMTTLAAMMGALPIALGIGAGAELRQPLGLTVVGGLVVSQLLTLYITPVIYIYLDKVADRFSHKAMDDEVAAHEQAQQQRLLSGK